MHSTAYPPTAPSRSAIAGSVHANLRSELLDALETDPSAVIQTPAWRVGYMAASDVVRDQLHGDDELFVSLLKIATDASHGVDVTTQAQLFCSVISERYASAHRGEVTDELMGDFS